MFDDFGLFT